MNHSLRHFERLRHAEEDAVRITLYGLSALCFAFCLLVLIYTFMH
jgi:hypothetical protein